MTDLSSKAEDWLTLLFYGLDMVLNPKPYKYLESFEAWDHRNRFRPHLYQLQRAKLLERRLEGKTSHWSITPAGRLAALGGVDPLEKWQRAWDGKWRLLLFDLSARKQQPRIKLWRWLREQRFGLLQQSVWVSPDKLENALLPVQFKFTAAAFTVIEGRPQAPVSDAELVQTAWDFNAINAGYEAALGFSKRGLELAEAAETKPVELRQWLALERQAWHAALRRDPFLPEALLPETYLGRKAWDQRQTAYEALAKRGTQADRK